MASATTPLGAGEALRALYDTFCAADYEGLGALFADDGIFEINAERHTGPDDIRRSEEAFRSTVTDCAVEYTAFLEQGDTAMCEAVFSFTQLEGGASVRLPFMAVAVMRDGRIARLTEYFDTGPLGGSA
jgi:ketosteroid isomerase-like protein